MIEKVKQGNGFHLGRTWNKSYREQEVFRSPLFFVLSDLNIFNEVCHSVFSGYWNIFATDNLTKICGVASKRLEHDICY